MGRKIVILPESISQVIAAGEVVERPASVVKELLENALDAGSTEITVELVSGGLELIRVRDNGAGIDPEDLSLAVQRYATSKIRTVDDLYALHSLGFRGEALPSIASVSRMTIETRVPGAVAGSRIVCEAGEISGGGDAGCPVGTEVSVRDLFFNIPVRRKFLKSIRAELRHALAPFLRLSLCYPGVAFRFVHDGRILHDLPSAASAVVRIEAVLGRDVYDGLQPLEWEDGAIRLMGYAGLPSVSKGNADGIYLYVNGRFVRDRMVQRAILEAYRHVLPSGRFPVVLLWITLPPSRVDVNIHPTKMEVKFSDGDSLFSAVHASLTATLGEPGARIGAEIYGDRPPREANSPVFGRDDGVFPGTVDSTEEAAQGGAFREEPGPGWNFSPGDGVRVVGQVGDTYIICEEEHDVIFIDQHAAHERLLYDEFRSAWEKSIPPRRSLLVPAVIDLSAEEALKLASLKDAFDAIGFEIDPVGDRAVAVRAYPAVLDCEDPSGAVKEILDQLPEVGGTEQRVEALLSILVKMACRTAVRGHVRLRQEEMAALVARLSPFNDGATCPHGRPLYYRLPIDTLRKQFKRSR